MDDSSESSFGSSYQEEYWLLKKQYDEVLESNSQMVLRLEEAKLTLFKNTRELQSQNSALMSENMNLRAQKEYLQQGLGKLGSLVGNLIEEMDTQKGSIKRQTGYLDELICLVKSVAENKDNDLTNPETEANIGEENAPFLNLTALRELDKQLRASTIGLYYLPAIEEEKCGLVDNDDDDESFDAIRPTRQPESSEQSHEVQQKIVQGKSKSNGRTVSKIGRRASSITTKKCAVKNEAFPHDGNGMGDDLALQTVESPEMIKKTSDEENEQKQATAIVRKSNNYMMANMESSTSTLTERKDSNHDSAQGLEEKRYNCRDNIVSKNRASETISSNSKDIGYQNPNIQNDLPETNRDMPQEMEVPQQTPNAIIMKNVATSYQVEAAQLKTGGEKYPKTRPGKSTSTEFMQIETKIQDKNIVGKVGKSICRVELVDLFCAAQPNHLLEVNINPQKQKKAVALLQNMKALSSTRNGEALKLAEGRDQPKKEKPENGSRISTNRSTGEASACYIAKDAVMNISPNCEDVKANDAHSIRETQSSSLITARISEISHAKEPTEPFNRRNVTPAETMSSENEESKPKKRCCQSQKPEECRNQPANRSQSSTNMSTAQSSVCCKARDAMMTTSQNCEDTKLNAARIQDLQSNEIKGSEISLPQVRNNPLNEPYDSPAETPCLVDKENKPRKTQTIRDANATENKTQQALLPLSTKSKYAKTKSSSSHSNLFTPVRDPSISAAKYASERDISLNLATTPDEDDGETRSISRNNGTFGQSKSCFLSPRMEDFRVSTGRALRESQMANSLLGEVRVSVASSQGESCYSDFATPKRVKRVRPYGLGQKELVSLLTESAAFQGNLGSKVMQEKRIMTRARSKPRRDQDKDVIHNFSSTSETDEPNGGFEFKPPGRRPRRGAKNASAR